MATFTKFYFNFRLNFFNCSQSNLIRLKNYRYCLTKKFFEKRFCKAVPNYPLVTIYDNTYM